MPIPLFLKVRLMIARSSEIEDLADSYLSAKKVNEISVCGLSIK